MFKAVAVLVVIFACANAFSAVYEQQRLSDALFYRGSSGYLSLSYNPSGVWTTDSGSFTAAGQVSGVISAVFEEQRNHSAVFFKGQDGLLHYYYLSVATKTWAHDGTSFAPAGILVGDISTVFEKNVSHAAVFVRGQDGYLHYFHVVDGVWTHDGQSFLAAGMVEGSISAVWEPRRASSAVFFRGVDGYLHYFYKNVVSGGWLHDGGSSGSFSLSQVSAAIGSVSACFEEQRNHSAVYFVGADGFLHFFYLNVDLWAHDGTSFGQVSGPLSSVFEPQRQHSAIFARSSATGTLSYFYVNNSVWYTDSASFASGGLVDGFVSAVWVPYTRIGSSSGHSSVFFRASDSSVQHFFAQPVWFSTPSSNFGNVLGSPVFRRRV